MSTHMPVHVSMHMSMHMSIHTSTHMSVHKVRSREVAANYEQTEHMLPLRTHQDFPGVCINMCIDMRIDMCIDVNRHAYNVCAKMEIWMDMHPLL